MKRYSKVFKSSLLMALMIATAFTTNAYELQDGELSWNAADGTASIIGQTNNDHMFVRRNNDGTADNTISFETGSTQLVWFWLDDDEIYETDWVQALTPDFVNEDGDRYNEITYYSVQFLLYVPQSLKLVRVENEDGDVISYETGPRLPIEGLVLNWGKRPGTKVVDGITYNIYSVVQTNSNAYCVHFSSRNPTLYKKNGALKKDDGALFGLYFENTHQDMPEGRIADLIIANQEFGIRETRLLDTNHQRFFYGRGGNNQDQRFHYYNRVAVYGSKGYTDVALLGDVNNNGEVNIDDLASLIDFLLAGGLPLFNAVNADMNNDGEIAIDDAAMLLDVLLLAE